MLQKLEDEVAQLQAANAELLQDKEEALPLLEAYRSATQPHIYSCTRLQSSWCMPFILATACPRFWQHYNLYSAVCMCVKEC